YICQSFKGKTQSLVTKKTDISYVRSSRNSNLMNMLQMMSVHISSGLVLHLDVVWTKQFKPRSSLSHDVYSHQFRPRVPDEEKLILEWEADVDSEHFDRDDNAGDDNEETGAGDDNADPAEIYK
ncbi:hypothetical protein Tco_0329244, partial [Tanacetum coccineum]